MEIPKDYIKCIEFEVRTEDYSEYYTDRLKDMLDDYISPYISTGNYCICFTLIKPLDKYTLNDLLSFNGIEYFEDITYIPYNRDENIDKLIKDGYNGKYNGKYLKYLMKYMPEKPILEKLSSVKFTVDIPNEIIEIDKLLQQLNIEKYFDDISNNYFTNKLRENIIHKYGFWNIYETKITNNIITIYYIQLPYQYRDKKEIDKIINNRSKYICSIDINNIDSK